MEVDHYAKHIEEWAYKNLDDVSSERLRRIKNVILPRGGWEPDYYESWMKKELHRWLTAWYTLEIKSLPKPATRRNPVEPWSYNEEDDLGDFHSRRRNISCPNCGSSAVETECFDVDGHWISCTKCGIIDTI